MVKTTIIFIRHGEVHNPKRVLYARSSRFRLSENGRFQITEAVNELAKMPISMIYSSPLLRARQTADFFSKKLEIKYKLSSYLLEVNTIFQGMPLDKYKKEIQPDQFDEKYVRIGHESVSDIEIRMLKFLRFIQKNHPGKTVLAVSHGDPIVILKARVSGQKFNWIYKLNNYLSTGKWLTVETLGGNYKLIN